MRDIRVYLIGGAPGVGKTTLACALAAKLGIASVTNDDLLTVAQTVTTPESHPGLHVMRSRPCAEYFTGSSVERLKEDASIQHEASWPPIENLMRKHTTWAPSPIVIDGWHLRPRRVAQVEDRHIWAGWIVASDALLEARERQNVEWIRQSLDPSRMLSSFLARSLWYNELIRQEATDLAMNVLHQDGTASVDDLCAAIVECGDG